MAVAVVTEWQAHCCCAQLLVWLLVVASFIGLLLHGSFISWLIDVLFLSSVGTCDGVLGVGQRAGFDLKSSQLGGVV